MNTSDGNTDPAAAIEQILSEGRSRPAPDLANERARHELRERAGDFYLHIGYAIAWFVVCVAQLGVMNAMMVATGLGGLEFDAGLLHAYLVGTFVECMGIVWLITRYLFPYRDQINAVA